VLTTQHYHWYAAIARRVASSVNYSRRRTESSSEHFTRDLSLLKALWCENKRCSDTNPWPMDPKASALPTTPQRATIMILVHAVFRTSVVCGWTWCPERQNPRPNSFNTAKCHARCRHHIASPCIPHAVWRQIRLSRHRPSSIPYALSWLATRTLLLRWLFH